MTDNPNIRKIDEFEAFIRLLKEGTLTHWVDIASVLGVDKDTITEWKKHPLAKQALVNGISHAIGEMERSGKNDWRMWREKLNMLGLNGKENTIKIDAETQLGPIVIYKPEKEI